MNNNPPSRYLQTGNDRSFGPITRAIVNIRTHEIALKAGHPEPHVTQRDYEQAKREITGESDPDRQAAALDAVQ